MIDGDFLLAPVAAEYLLGSAAGRDRAAEFLSRRTPGATRTAEALARNVALVLPLAAPFAETRDPMKLIGLKAGTKVGEWRDSEQGLAGGRIPYDVNAALVPAALRASARLLASPLLGADAERAGRAERLARAWKDAGVFFQVELPEDEARRARVALCGVAGPGRGAGARVALGDALGSSCRRARRRGQADPHHALRRQLRPAVHGAAARCAGGDRGPPDPPVPGRPADAGGDPGREPRVRAGSGAPEEFTAAHYHGTVTWSWQQAMLAAGLERQLGRGDLPARARGALERARSALWEVIAATREASTRELWSWAFEGGCYKLVPFGAERLHHDESNAVQLWSTVYLAVRP